MKTILSFSNLAKIATIALVGSILVVASPAQASPLIGEAKTIAASNSNEKLSYIVVFQDGTNVDLEASRVRGLGGEVGFKYTNVFRGLSAKMNASQLRALANNPRVQMIELDGVVTASDLVEQPSATWGIDRIDQATTPLSTTYKYSETGSGVTAYVIDTGILSLHAEFGSRVKGAGYTAINDGRGSTDCNGHGTHVAGTIGGTTYGVAKNVDLVAVRVLDCSGSGSTSGVVAGMDWVVADAVGKRAVVNMSLGGGASTSMDAAVVRLVDSGVTTVVAAGNSNASACNYSPARAAKAITVGATTSADAKASYSNYGSCVDINAPGTSITSAWYTSNTDIKTISGTSMASPHVAGAAALLLSQATLSPSQVDSQLKTQATKNVLTSLVSGTPNSLLFTNPVATVDPNSTVPAQVNDLNLPSSTSSSISATWTAPNDGGSAITSYKLQYSTNSAFSPMSETTVFGTSATISGLAADTLYYVRVAATNGKGTGEFSASANLKTLVATVALKPATPTNLTARATSRSSISVSWTPPAGTVTGYVFEWSTSSTFSTLSRASLTSTQTAVSVTRLKSYTLYYFRVRAVNSVGTSDFTSPVSARTL